MKKSRTLIMVVTGLLAGIGLVYLIIRYSDKLIELIETLRKRAFLKLDLATSAPAYSDFEEYHSEEAFYPGYDTELDPEGTPQPNIPSDE